MSNWTDRANYMMSVQRCVRCGKQDAYTLVGKQRCYECVEKGKEEAKHYNQSQEKRRKNKERYDWLKSKGMCVSCGKTKAQTNRVMCKRCAVKINEANKRNLLKRERMVENG
jgi:NMD protein affecting ribosome stability and mRNA decay